MSSYLPENSFVLCTNHVGTGYRQLLKDGDRRSQETVYLGASKKLFLVEVDIKIDSDFNCKTQWNSVVSNAALGGGVAAGLLSIAAVSALIPGPGWVVAAICVGAVAVSALAMGLIGYFSNRKKCSNLLSSVGTSWQLPHPSVKFDTHAALTKTSFIQCQEGGQLIPFVSELAAKEAASSVGWRTIGEVGTNGAVSVISGFLLGNGLGTVVGALYGLGSVGVSYIIGTEVMPMVYDEQESSIRKESEYEGADRYYQQMNKSSDELNRRIEAGELDVDEKRPDASVFYGDQPIGIYDQSKGLPGNDDNLRDNKGARKTYDGAVQNTKDGKSNSAKNNPALRDQMIKDKEIFINKNGTRAGTNNSKNHKLARNKYDVKTKWNNARIGAGIVTLVAPFGGYYLGEKARDIAASYAIQDMDYLSVSSDKW